MFANVREMPRLSRMRYNTSMRSAGRSAGLLLLISALGVVTLVACGGESESSSTPAAAGKAAAAVPQAVTASNQQMVIECIFFDGRIYRTEADEYVQLLNQGDTPVDLAGWRVMNATDGSPSFTFPSHTVMPGDRVRVYNNQDHLVPYKESESLADRRRGPA